MAEIVLGIIVLTGLVAFQGGLRYWTVLRTRKSWESAQDAIAAGDYATAEAAITKCVKLMPLWLQPRFLLGAVLARQGKLEAAEVQFKMAQALQPRDPGGHIELGIFYVTAANRIDDGLAAFREAIANDAAARERIEKEPRLREFRDTPAFASLDR